MRAPRPWVIVLGGLLLAASIGLSMHTAQQSIREEQDRRLAARVADKAELLEGYFQQARTVLALMAEGPEFGDPTSAERPAGAADAAGAVIGGTAAPTPAERSLRYLATLYPDGALSEACLIDHSGREIARVVGDQIAAPGTLSPDETKNAFFAATFERQLGTVYQAAPYVSPDTGEWVVSNSVVIPDANGAPSAILHFEVRLADFERRLGGAGGPIRVVDGDQGSTLLSSSRSVRPGDPLIDSTAPVYVPVVNATAAAGVLDFRGERLAYHRVSHDDRNANDWIVVTSEPPAAASLLSGVGAGSVIALIAGVLLVWVLVRLQSSQRQLQVAATTDALTGLPNRELLFDRITMGLSLAARQGSGAAVLLIDLDRFKEVNDTLGHHHGDELLRLAAASLAVELRESDTLARIGGDEFMVFLPDVRTPEDALSGVRRLQTALMCPFIVGGVRVQVGGSIGIALFPRHGDSPEVLMQHADVAMYAAKRAHLGVALYEPTADENTENRLRIAAELADAIDSRRLVVHYQPKVRLASGEVSGVEALVRWQHPEFGLIPPDQFISVAEDTGLIHALTVEVLDQALGQIRAWRADDLDVTVAVNVSARSLIDDTLPREVGRLLALHDLPGAALVLEITETALVFDHERAVEILGHFRDLGIELSIDDFGTGYSSLATLQSLPVDEIKIDRRFVMSMTSEEKDSFIVRSTVALGRNLGLRVVAEGVEDASTLDELRMLGCDVAQGYLMSRPLPAEEARAWIVANRPVGPTGDQGTTAVQAVDHGAPDRSVPARP